ncbi:phage minor capsid protein [Paenibacillus naphthalenovorans]|uniref:phage minor capsid protein n=1 Tax=Paenibacillus naphthalenovorans TaxID=162209 RepID=UPI003D2BC882
MDKVEALIKVYQEAQQRLINIIAYQEARGNVTWYQETLLRQVRIELAKLDAYSSKWVRDAINESYSLGAQEAVVGLQKLGLDVNSPETFARLHTAAIELIIANTSAMLMSGTAFVGRQIEDNIRQAGLQAIAQKLSTGATIKETSRLIKEKLIQNGINAIRDKRGRLISLDVYAATVARTTTREATNTATTNQLEYLGYDLVKMSSHATTCPVCAAYQGRVYSISGNTPGYPKLSIAFSSGHANIHPNCRHIIFPYVPELADDLEGDKAFSNLPFDIDERSKTEIQRYNKNQAEKRKLRMDKHQWEQYKLALGDKAPKTLAGFRRMKESNNERYNKLKEDYKNFKSMG